MDGWQIALTVWAAISIPAAIIISRALRYCGRTPTTPDKENTP